MSLLLTASALVILLGVQNVWLTEKWDNEQTYFFGNENTAYSPAIEFPKADLKYKTNEPSRTTETGIVFSENGKKNYTESARTIANASEESVTNYQSPKIAKVGFQNNSYYQNQQPEKTEAKNKTEQQTVIAYKGIPTSYVKQFSNPNTSTFIADNTISTSTDLTPENNSPMMVGPTGNPGDPGVIPVGDGIPFLLALIALYGARKVFFNS